MPGKKSGKGKGKKKAKKRAKAGLEFADVVLLRFLKSYEKCCEQFQSRACPSLCSALKKCIAEEKLLVKFIMDSVMIENQADLPVLMEPFLLTLRNERYTSIKDLHIWDYPMTYENVASMSLLLEKPAFQLRQLELMDCLLTSQHIRRLIRIMPASPQLVTLNLDYNEFGDNGCASLCTGLANTNTLLSLSLCFCDLGVQSGRFLGHLISTTTVRELYLDGNNLECEGAMELIKMCTDQAEVEAYEREEADRLKAEQEALLADAKATIHPVSGISDGEAKSDGDNKGGKKKKKKKGRRKKKEPPPPPVPGPWLHKLHLVDNGIDSFSKGANFAPIICMRLFSTLVCHSKCLQELDIDDNLIGDLAGRQLMEALEKRQEAKLASLKVRTTHRLNAATLSVINKLGSGLKKKKRKGRGKKKKK